MTDKEIIKALECCETSCCTQCPYCGDDLFISCHEALTHDALDLINRQKAEIERLTAEVTAINNDYDNLMVEKDELFDNAEALIKTVFLPEAIKEFAEKTNEMITEIYNKHIFGSNDLEDEEKDAIINFCDDVTYGFDNLVKQMTGEQQ